MARGGFRETCDDASNYLRRVRNDAQMERESTRQGERIKKRKRGWWAAATGDEECRNVAGLSGETLGML